MLAHMQFTCVNYRTRWPCWKILVDMGNSILYIMSNVITRFQLRAILDTSSIVLIIINNNNSNADVRLVKNTAKMQSILFSVVSMLFVVSFSVMWKSTKILFYFMFYHDHIITIFHLLRFASFLCRCYVTFFTMISMFKDKRFVD